MTSYSTSDEDDTDTHYGDFAYVTLIGICKLRKWWLVLMTYIIVSPFYVINKKHAYDRVLKVIKT